jgi:hypothetical protein
LDLVSSPVADLEVHFQFADGAGPTYTPREDENGRGSD